MITNNEIKQLTVTEDEVKNSVVSLSKLDTLVIKIKLRIFNVNVLINYLYLKIFIKSMIKKRSFGHPFRMHNSSNSIDIN